MEKMKNRIKQLVKKEFIQLRRDKKFLRMIIFAPIVQLFIFGYVATTDVTEIPLAVLDNCNTYQSRVLIQKFTESGYFKIESYISNYRHADRGLDNSDVDAVLVIPADYARDLKRGKTASLQILVNGINSNTASIVSNYANTIIMNYSEKIILNKLERLGQSGARQPVEVRDRVWFNPELKSQLFFVPGIIAFLVMMMLMPVTSMSLVREKETGTIEQLDITPLTSVELIIGKVIPFIIIGYFDVTLITFIGTLWFGIPVKGSLILLYLFAGLFIITSLTLGIFISSVSENMTQAFMGGIFFLMPNILLSGFIFPISSMPEFFQYVTYLIPMRYFLVVIRGIFLKGTGLAELWPQAVALILLTVFIFALSRWFVASRSRN